MKMLTDSEMSTCPPVGVDNSVTIYEFIVWLALCLSILVTAIFDILVTCHQDEVRRIDKEAKFLKALQKDYKQLQNQENEVESRARSFWHSELNLDGIRSKLNKAERQWVKSTEEVVRAVENCVKSFNEQMDRYGLTALLRLISIWEVVRQIHKVRRDIKTHLDKEDKDIKHIYQSMEESRSNYRSLLDRQPIQGPVRTPLPKPSTRPRNLQDLMSKSRGSFSGLEERWSIYLLLPLHAFLIDLSQLQLETDTEKSWKTEAEELIEEAEVCIDNFLRWASIFDKIWISSSNIPIVAFQFKRKMKLIFTEFDDLLGRKQRYGFNFNDTAAEKSTFPSTHQYTNDDDSTSAVANIRRRLGNEEESSRQANHFISLLRLSFNELNDINDELHKREETAGRNACLKQIKRICQEANQILDDSLKSNNGVLELKHCEQIENAVKRLKQIINVCNIISKRPKSVVGLKSDIRRLVLNLTTGSDTHSKLAIVGMKGIGKTVLANEIYYNKTVADHFSVRAWMQVSRKPYETQVLLIRKDGKREQLPLNFVGDHLKEETCLLVVDDVSSQQEWNVINESLPELSNSSRVVVTTSSKDVAWHADRSITLHQLRLQTKEESWELFNMVTPHYKSDRYMEKLAKLVVGRCGGLPLAILSLGCLLLANGVTEEQLLRALKEINQGQNQTPWLQVWKENSKDLNRRETLRKCLYYFTLFPIDYEIPSRTLVTLWDAEGLVKQNARFNDNKETQEDDAEKCLEELRNRYVIQAVQLKSNGKIKTCWLPSMLRELIKEDSNQTNRSQYFTTRLPRRFAYHVDDRGLDSNVANAFSKKDIPLSVLFFDKREGSKPGEHIGSIIYEGITSKQFMEIRVLDLERVFRPHLSKEISKFTHLKYLGLRWTFLEAIPTFIGKLVKLETLDVKHTCIRVIPRSIWRLKNLKNLYLSQHNRCRIEGELSSNFPESLQILWGVFIDEGSPLLHELHKLKNLRKLKLAFQLTKQEKLVKQIVKLNQLQSLRLRSIDEIGEPQHIRLYNMSKLEKLSSLHLFGSLEYRLLARQLPQSLTDLTLSASELSDDPMPELQKLPKLKSLSFYAKSYTGKHMICSRGNFQKLQVLRFWKLEDLEKWNIEEGAMPDLKELEFKSCKKLEFPDGLKHLKSLHTIMIPEQFKEAAERNKLPFWDIIENLDD